MGIVKRAAFSSLLELVLSALSRKTSEGSRLLPERDNSCAYDTLLAALWKQGYIRPLSERGAARLAH